MTGDEESRAESFGDAMNNAASEAIAQHGGIVTGMLGMITYIDADGEQRWSLFSAPGQIATVGMGLAETLRAYMDDNVRSMIRAADD